MKLKFKVQPYQTNAVEALVDCFAGQVNTSGIVYRIDPGVSNAQQEAATTGQKSFAWEEEQQAGFKNADMQLSDGQILDNIHAVQRRQHMPLSDRLVTSAGCKVNLDVEMETGIGKIYCYGKTVFFVNEPPCDLVACFDTGVNEELVKELARFEPLRVVFRDTGFVSDAVKINVGQIFRQMSPGTEVKAI